MDQIDGLEGAQHDLEVYNSSVVIPGDQVDAIHTDAIDFHHEFQSGVVIGDDLANIPK